MVVVEKMCGMLCGSYIFLIRLKCLGGGLVRRFCQHIWTLQSKELFMIMYVQTAPGFLNQRYMNYGIAGCGGCVGWEFAEAVEVFAWPSWYARADGVFA